MYREYPCCVFCLLMLKLSYTDTQLVIKEVAWGKYNHPLDAHLFMANKIPQAI